MLTLTQITNAIAKQIQGVVETHMLAEDYNVIVCPERIFVDDYLPLETQYITKMSELPDDQYDNPNEPPYKNTIFVVIKMGSGERNMAVANSTVTLQVLSEENDFLAAREIIDEFIAEYNFEIAPEGFIQAYFTPDVMASQEQVYAGFRALLSTKGFIRVPEPGVVFIRDVFISLDNDMGWVRMPFIMLNWNHAAQPDPQAFSGNLGSTMTLNKQATQTVSFNTYLVQSKDHSNLDMVCANIILAMSDINRKFHIAVLTDIPLEDAFYEGMDSVITYTDSKGEQKTVAKVHIINDWFVLASASYNQELGDLSPWSLAFSRAKMEED